MNTKIFSTKNGVVFEQAAQTQVRSPVIFRATIPSNKRIDVSVSAQSSTQLNAVAAEPATAAGTYNTDEWEKTASELAGKSPLEVMDHALKTFGDEIAIAFSGAEDVAVIEYAKLTGRPFRVFSLDTGRLNPETYQVFEAVEKHYGIHIEYTFPDSKEVTDLVRAKGMFSFYEDGHQECCRVRKVRPLRRQLKTLKAWITGQRKDQSPGTRTEIPLVQVDPVFEGVTGGPSSLIKYNPVADVSSEEIWNFLRTMEVPTNALHAQGFVSIGCEPCTRAVLPNQHEREGRWWWEDSTRKECGLHSGNIKNEDGEEVETEGSGSDVNTAGRKAERDLWIGESAVETVSKEQLAALLEGNRDKSTLVVLYAPWCPFCQAMEGFYEELAKEMGGENLRVAKFQGDIEREFVTSKFGLKSFPTIVMLNKSGEGNFAKYLSERRDPKSLGMWAKTVM